MKRRRLSVAIGFFVLVGTASPSGAATQVGGYDAAYPARSTSPDMIGSPNSASASSRADVSGAVSADATASSDSPAGATIFGLNAGGASSVASGNVVHNFPVAAGTYAYSVTFSGVTRSVSPSSWQGGDYYGISPSFSAAGTYAAVYAHFYPCPASASCLPDYAASTTAGGQDPVGTATFSGTIVASTPGRIVVIAGLAAYANARGAKASASATTSGTIASISVN